MGKARPLKGTLCCCQSAQACLRLEIQFGRGEKNAEHFVPAQKEERSWPGETSEPSIPNNRLGGATHLLRLVLEEQNRVWERLGESSDTDTDLWPCSASFAEISAGLIVQGSHTVSKLPLCPSRFLCRKPNAVKSSATSYGGRCPSLFEKRK